MPYERIRLTRHAAQRLAQRGITVEDVRLVVIEGKLIEDYPDDLPRPSYLMLGWQFSSPMHVVAADDPATEETVIVTAYRPDPALWESDFRRRRR